MRIEHSTAHHHPSQVTFFSGEAGTANLLPRSSALPSPATSSHTRGIQQEGAGNLDWSSYPFEYLVRQVLRRQHLLIRQHLATLHRETGAEPGQSGSEDQSRPIRNRLRALAKDLLEEMAEEEHIFPDLLHLEQAYVGERPGYEQHLRSILARLSRQNDRHLHTLDALRRAAASLGADSGQAGNVQLAAELGRLQTMLLSHLHLEHDVIFPRAACMEAELFRDRHGTGRRS